MTREDFRLLVAHAICCGGLLLLLLASAYGTALVGAVRDNALLVALSLAGLGVGATLFVLRRRARGS